MKNIPVNTNKIFETDLATFALKTTDKFNEWLNENHIYDFRFYYNENTLEIIFEEEEHLCQFILRWC